MSQSALEQVSDNDLSLGAGLWNKKAGVGLGGEGFDNEKHRMLWTDDDSDTSRSYLMVLWLLEAITAC